MTAPNLRDHLTDRTLARSGMGQILPFERGGDHGRML
jgi:hypothetical protein